MSKADKRREQIEKRLPDLNRKKAVCGVCGGVEEGDAWTAMGHATFYHFPVSKCVTNLKGQLAAAKAEHAAELSRQVTQFQKVLDAAKEDGERFQAENERLRKALQGVIENDKTTYRHHEPRRDGMKPGKDGGTIWLTPTEIAKRALEG